MDRQARFSQFVEKHVDQAEYGERERDGGIGDLEIRKVTPKIDLFFLPSSIPTLRKSRSPLSTPSSISATGG